MKIDETALLLKSIMAMLNGIPVNEVERVVQEFKKETQYYEIKGMFMDNPLEYKKKIKEYRNIELILTKILDVRLTIDQFVDKSSNLTV